MFYPARWNTSSTVLKEMLLSTLGPASMAPLECAKELPITKMTKPQFRQVDQSSDHDVPREGEGGRRTERMKRISHLNMPELKLKVRVLGVEYPENVTKEDLLQLVRDSINTQDNELMKIRIHRGMEFR